MKNAGELEKALACRKQKGAVVLSCLLKHMKGRNVLGPAMKEEFEALRMVPEDRVRAFLKMQQDQEKDYYGSIGQPIPSFPPQKELETCLQRLQAVRSGAYHPQSASTLSQTPS